MPRCGHYLDSPVQKRILFLACAAVAFSQTPPATSDPAYAELDKAYQELKAKKYDSAIAGFERAIALAPDRPSVRKDLAYTLLKVGETAAARDQFAAAMRLDPGDDQVALEYAFLCYETHQEVAARRIFDRYRKSSATAAQAFENIDRPLRDGIERWRQALAASPDNFSGHLELARLAEQRDELALAAEHYEQAWHLRPDHRDLLLDLGRVWKQLDRSEEAAAALLAASRGAEPRVAEQARELLPDRYPYVYEFEKALALDPSNVELRREFAYLQLQMEHRSDAETQFAGIVERAPADLSSVAQLGLLKLSQGDGPGAMALLNRVLSGSDEELADRVRAALRLPETLRGRAAVAPAVVPNQAKEMAFKSLEKGYLKDALRYLTIAHENDPVDFEVMLKLGWANNLLKDDRDAIKWFNLARQSPDVKIAVEAARASHNLAGSARALPHHSVGVPYVFYALARFVRLRAGQDGIESARLVHPALRDATFCRRHARSHRARRWLRSAVSIGRRRDPRAWAWPRAPGTAPPVGLKPAKKCATAPPPPIPAAVRPTIAAACPTRKGLDTC